MNPVPGWFERWCGTGAQPQDELVAVSRILRQRPWLIGGMTVLNFALLRMAEYPVRRFVVLLAVAAAPLAMAILGALQPAGPAGVRDRLWRSLFASDIFVPALALVTGGLRSPFVPVLLANVVIIVLLWHGRRPVWWLLGVFAAGVAVLVLAPPAITGPTLARPYFELMAGLNLMAALYTAIQVVVGVSEGFVSARRSLDVVRERTLEATAQRVRSLEQVGSRVAHELKNPLAAVKGLVHLERRAASDERSRQRLEVMMREVGRMEAVLRDYLSFSRPLEDLRVGPVDLAEVAEAVVLLLEGRAAAASVRLQRTGESVPMGGDARRLEEALLNIASNAIEATPAGGSVTVRTERRPSGGAIVVTDTGKGMTRGVLQRVGTPFFTTRREGTGLGVVLARAVVVQHGGTLEFASTAGQGTAATFALPDSLRIAGAIAEGMIHGPSPAG